jgi:nitric oxide reductase activation protein
MTDMASAKSVAGSVGSDTERYRVLLDRLGATSPKLAAAFMEMAPTVAHHCGYDALGTWAEMGERMATGGWTNLGLAVRLFQRTPRLLKLVDMDDLGLLADSVTALSSRVPEVATTFLRSADVVLESVPADDRHRFLLLLQQVVLRCWADADRCIEQVPGLIEGLTPEVRPGFLDLARAAIEDQGAGSLGGVVAAGEALVATPAELAVRLTGEAVELADRHPLVGIEILSSAPRVLDRLDEDAASRWRRAGRDLLDDPGGEDRALAWFRLESARSKELLAELAGRVELGDVAAGLRRYGEALTGRDLVVQPVGVLAARRIGWSPTGRATTDGRSVFLPPSVDIFDDHDSNLAVYKVHLTLQSARITHGSFDFRLGVDGRHLPATVQDRPVVHRSDPRWPGVQQLNARFDQRSLFASLFALADGTRIEAVVAREYPGIRSSLDRLRERVAARRPVRSWLSPRQGFTEGLVFESLGHPELAPVELPRAASDLIGILRLDGTTVQDSAEVAAALYDMAMQLSEEAPRPPRRGSSASADASAEEPTGQEVLAQPEHHGDYQPEAVQVLDLFEGVDEGEGVVLTRAEMLDLLEEILERQEEDGPFSRDEIESMLDRMEDTEGDEEQGESIADQDAEAAPEPDEADAAEVTWYEYDEWDHRAHDYLRGHCRVGERAAEEGPEGVYEDTLTTHRALVGQTRRRFEQLRPEAFRKINRLEDGSDIDLDEAIAFHADKLAGSGPLARFYTRRNKVVRDVAVALLIDQSASTREPIEEGGRRVIDVVRDATVLMVEAIEATGDTYGIYGFSGQGRLNVELRVFKEPDLDHGDVVRRRIGGIEPMGSTRMGPAIRHVTAKLDAVPAKVKLLILVSDGRPEDEDYGPERGAIDYPLHDTRKALLEAKQKRIEPFLITVDTAGADYLAQMCDDIGYEVVAEVEALPARLTRLYRHLTAD